MRVDDGFKLKLLLSCLQITCCYFKGGEEVCGLSEKCVPEDTDIYHYPYSCHVACNCDGDIERCDLPDKFQVCL